MEYLYEFPPVYAIFGCVAGVYIISIMEQAVRNIVSFWRGGVTK